MKRAALLGILAVTLAIALPARGDAIEARYFDERAREQFALHHYAAALELFLHAQDAAPSPGTLYNVGVSADLAHQPSVAYAHLDEYVQSERADLKGLPLPVLRQKLYNERFKALAAAELAQVRKAGSVRLLGPFAERWNGDGGAP